ncbi:permease [Hydrogenivirga sp.]
MLLQIVQTFWHYLIDILPYFLLASLVGAFIQTYAKPSFIRRGILSKPYAPFMTALFGAGVPVCSCSMIPVARTFDGFSPRSYAPVIAFLITAPVLSPVVLLLTFGMLGWELTLMRALLSFAFAILLAYASAVFFSKKGTLPLLQGASAGGQNRLREFANNFRSLFITTGRYVLLGLLIASLFKVLIPQSFISSLSSSPLSYPLISLLSIPIYVCSGEEVPIGKSLYELGMSPGQVLTFLLASSGICVPTITALFSFLPKGLVLFYAFSWFVFATISGVVTDLLWRLF